MSMQQTLLGCVTVETTTSPTAMERVIVQFSLFLNSKARKENLNLHGWFYMKCVRDIEV